MKPETIEKNDATASNAVATHSDESFTGAVMVATDNPPIVKDYHSMDQTPTKDQPTTVEQSLTGELTTPGEQAFSEQHLHLILQNNRTLSFYKAFSIVSVLLYPFFSYFLYLAVLEAGDEFGNELGIESRFWEIVCQIAAAILASIDGATGLLIVNPIEEALEFFNSNEDDRLAEKLQSLTSRQQKGIKRFAKFNRLIANTVNGIVASADMVAISKTTSNPGIQWGFGIPVGILGLIYLNMILIVPVNNHSVEIVISPKEAVLRHMIHAPAKFFEVLIQILVNGGNRGISRGYMMKKFLNDFFHLHNGNTMAVFVIYAVGAAFYVSIVSRTLNVAKKFFNERITKLSKKTLDSVKISKSGYFIDGLMTLLRAGAVSTLIFRNGPNNIYGRIFLSLACGFPLLVQTLCARLSIRRSTMALAESDPLDVHLLEEHQQNLRENPRKIFSFVQDQFKTVPSFKTAATVFNTGSRLTSWLSFLGFLTVLNKLLHEYNGSSFDFADLFCIQQLLCNPSIENDASFFYGRILDALSYYRTKVYFERNEPLFGLQASFKSTAEYPEEYFARQPILIEFNRQKSKSILTDLRTTPKNDPTNHATNHTNSPTGSNGSKKTMTFKFDSQSVAGKNNTEKHTAGKLTSIDVSKP